MSIPVPSFVRLKATRWRRILHWGMLLVAVAVYFQMHLRIGFSMVDQTRHAPDLRGQSAVLAATRIAAERARAGPREGVSAGLRNWLPHYTDGVVNPLWPRIAATFVDPAAADTALLEAGKRWNVWFSACFLCTLALVLGSRWSLPAILIFLPSAGLGAFLPAVSWFLPDTLFLALFLLSWLAAMSLLRENRISRYAVFGLWTSLAYLADPVILPLVVVFILVSSLRFLAAIRPRFGPAAGPDQQSAWSPSHHFIGLAVLLATQLLLASPRLAYAQSRFGHPLHHFTVCSLWFDDAGQAEAWRENHPGRAELQAVPPDARPSLRRYLATHGTEAARQRLADGSWAVTRALFVSQPTARDIRNQPHGPWNAPLERPGRLLAAIAATIAVAAAFVISQRRKEKLPIHRQEPERGTLTLLAVSTFAAYSLLFGWMTPIDDHPHRLSLLLAPITLTLIAAGESMVRRLVARQTAPIMPFVYRAAQWCIAAALAWRLFELCQFPRFS